MLLTRPAVLGALCWHVAGPLFLAANLLASLGWRDPRYNWATNNISDLGNVHCGVWDTTRPRYVCSPWHTPMNAAFILTGMLLAAGILLGWRAAARAAAGPAADATGARRRAVAARTTMVLLLFAALGYGLAGAFPADVHENQHFLGALLVLLAGNVGLLAAAFTTRGRARAWTLVAAGVAVTGALLFFDRQSIGIGVGAMERLAVFPLPIWACCAGTGLLAAHLAVLSPLSVPAHR
jgi:hypothetical membrane protein